MRTRLHLYNVEWFADATIILLSFAVSQWNFDADSAGKEGRCNRQKSARKSVILYERYKCQQRVKQENDFHLIWQTLSTTLSTYWNQEEKNRNKSGMSSWKMFEHEFVGPCGVSRGRRSHPTPHPFLRLVNLQKFDDNLGLISSVDIPSFMEPKSRNFDSTVPDKICFCSWSRRQTLCI